MKRIAFPITVDAKTANNIYIASYVDALKTSPFDYAGYTFIAEIKKKDTDESAIATFAVSAVPSIEFPDTNHVLRLFLSYSASMALNGIKKPVWDLLCIPPEGEDYSYRPYYPSVVTVINGVSD